MIHIVVVEKILNEVGKSTAPNNTQEHSINKPVMKLGRTLKIQKILAVTIEAKTTMPAWDNPCGVGIKNAIMPPRTMPIMPVINFACFILTTLRKDIGIHWELRHFPLGKINNGLSSTCP